MGEIERNWGEIEEKGWELVVASDRVIIYANWSGDFPASFRRQLEGLYLSLSR